MAGEEVLGPRRLPLKELSPKQFQDLCNRLVRVEWKDARATGDPDSGADSLLPKPGGKWERGWQAKHFPGNIAWGKCKDSLDRAVEAYKITRMTFCFPRDLTVNQERLFQKHLVGRHKGVRVDYWNETEILERLDTEEGKRIARHFFGDPTHDKELMVRAIRAGGPLESSEDAVERVRPVGEFLDGHDPYFAYPQVQHPEDVEMPSTPGAMMSIAKTEGGSTVRIDAIPRDPDAAALFAPKLTISFTDDEDGQRAAERLHDALKRTRSVAIDKGVTVTPKQLPPLYGDLVDKPIKGDVSISLKPNIPPWDAEMTVKTSVGSATVNVLLELMDDPPDDWDIGLEGFFGGLTMRVLLAKRGEGGEMAINWNYRFDSLPARDQLAALSFVVALHGEGILDIRDRQGGRPPLRHATTVQEVDDQTLGLLGLLEDIVAIEDWSGVQLEIPDEIDARSSQKIATTATCVRQQEIPIKWNNARARVDRGSVVPSKRQANVVIEHMIDARLLGQDIPLGKGRLALPEIELAVHEIDGSDSDEMEMRPIGAEALDVSWKLTPPLGDDDG
jgi:hypothetical protein